MLKETETEETIDFLSLLAFKLRESRPPPHLAMPMAVPPSFEMLFVTSKNIYGFRKFRLIMCC